VLVSGTSLPMAKTGQEVPRCAYPGCENEPRPGEAGAAAEPKYCGLPDPVTGEPHTALTAFRRRQLLARQGGGAAGPEDLGRPGFAFWRRAGAQRRQRAEAEAGEARLAVLEAGARLADALAAKAAAEQEAVAAREAARAWVADVQRAADERVAAAQQERDEAVAGAESRAGQAESRAAAAGQDVARAREAAGSARAELDRARQDADRQVAQVRGDAARDQAGLRQALEARIAAAAEARDGFQARAEQAEAELQRVRADRDQAAGQATPGQPTEATRRRRRSGGK
jgi:hypothetical protein